MSSSIKSILGSVVAITDTTTAVLEVGHQYATGWSARSALAERTRMVQAEYEHKVAMVAIPEEAALELAKRIQKVSDKAKDLKHYDQAKVALASIEVESNSSN